MTFYEWRETLANDTSLFSLEEQAWDYQQKRIDELKDKLAEAAIIPEGYMLVPVEPTEAMLDLASDKDVAKWLYKEMIQAAQEEE